jgi:membrane protease YdiL (CAAX protease family)
VEAREFDLQQKNAELEESLKLRSLASGLLLWFTLGISLFIFILAFFYQPGLMDPVKPLLIRWFGTVFILGQVVLMTILIRQSGFPLSAFGLTWHNARKSVRESLVTSAIFILGLILLKIWLIHSDSMLKGKPLIALEEFNTLFLYLFFISAPMQEFLVRGVLQSSAERIITGKRKIFWSVVSISLIFSALHTIYSLTFALLTFTVSLLWGWLYARHHTIIGVSICHLLMGLAFILLGFWEVIAF